MTTAMIGSKTAVEAIARVCHEANRAYCVVLGDSSQLPWDEAADWQRSSAIKGVEFALSGTCTPAEMHELWLAEKAAQGWKYGPAKNADTKEHPCFLPYDELPADQRYKDALFQAVVAALR